MSIFRHDLFDNSSLFLSPLGEDEGVMPRKVENYLSFLDLEWVVASCSEDEATTTSAAAGVSPRTWHAFLLKDFDPNSDLSAVPLRKLRRRLKRFLPQDKLSSVQMDLDHQQQQQQREEAAASRVFFRVATVARTKSGKNDEGNLLKKPATFLAFYPGEPYFYCDRSAPEAAITEVSSNGKTK